ncbi:MAG TPA: hypothetical protein GX534_00235 [Thermoanaerobacterales bacterium]|nr:hypothetical protein [Thermoanaerobacterales bacterium]
MIIILKKIFLRILYASLTSTTIALLIFFIGKIFKDKLTPRFHHILWFLVLIRLLMPFAPESNLSIFNLLPGSKDSTSLEALIPSTKETEPLTKRQIDMAINKAKPDLTNINKQRHQDNNFLEDDLLKPKKSILNKKETNKFENIIGLISCAWLIGFLTMAAFLLTAAIRFKKDTKTFDKITHPKILDILNNCKKRLAINTQIELFCGKGFRSPFIFGILKPRIYLPKHILNKIDDQELSHILLHELSHYKRKDLLCNLLSTLAIMLHWFNPIVWFAMKKMRADIECACDMYVLENLQEDEFTHYGRTIIKLSSLISSSQHNKMLYAYFYEGKDQIERRIILINMFKKGSYKLSAIALIFFIALGCCTLTNAETGTNTTLKPEKNTETEQFSFDEPEKVFSTLDRAMDFIDFDFKVPDKMPTDYEFDKIFLYEEKGLASVDFTKVDVDKQIGVSILVSNNDMIKYLKEKHSDANEKVINERTIKPNIKFSEEPMNISNIQGTCLTISKDWDIKEEDLEDYRKHDTERIKVRPITKIVEKYFIWQDENIWYSIPYYCKNGDFAALSISEIPKDDIKILLSSLKYPKDIQNIEYKSRDYDRFLEIYSNKDLETAREILGFAPKFPLNLPGGFVPVSSLIRPFSETLHDNKLVEMIKMETIFQLKDKDSIQEISLNQTKDTSKYDDMIQNKYISLEYYKDPVDAKVKNNVAEKKIDVVPIMINDVKVLKYELDITNPNIISKGITKTQNYIWKQNDAVYETQFIGDTGNQQEIVRALIKTR